MKKMSSSLLLVALFSWGCSSAPVNEKAPPAAPLADPALETTAQWTIPADHAIKNIAVVSTGNDAAIAYGESEGDLGSGFTQTRIQLQRLDTEGKLRGPAIELGTIPFARASAITIAADTERYFVCWNGDDEAISCASAPVLEGDAKPWYSTTGRAPALAFGPAGLVLARVQPDAIVTIPLNADGSVNGEEITYPYLGVQEAPVLFRGSEKGYLFLAQINGTMRVQKLASSLEKDGPEIDLGNSFWFHATIAQSPTNTAIGLAIPYGMKYYLLDHASLIDSRQFDDTVSGKTGIYADLVQDNTAFGMLSPDNGGGLRYGVVQDDDTLAPADVVLKLQDQNYENGSFGTFSLKGEAFFAAAPGIPHQGGSIVVAHVKR